MKRKEPPLRYLKRLFQFPMMLVEHSADAVVSASVGSLGRGLQVQAVKGFLPRSRHHVNFGSKPLLKLILFININNIIVPWLLDHNECVMWCVMRCMCVCVSKNVTPVRMIYERQHKRAEQLCEKIKFILPFSYRGPQQQCVCVPQRGVCAGALNTPLRQPVEQEQQETPGAHSTSTHQDPLPQTGPVTPHLLHGQTLMTSHSEHWDRYTAL